MNTIVRINERLIETVTLFDQLIECMKDFTENYATISTEERRARIIRIRGILQDMEQHLNVA